MRRHINDVVGRNGDLVGITSPEQVRAYFRTWAEVHWALDLHVLYRGKPQLLVAPWLDYDANGELQ
jgi:hypothetical protein